MDSTYSQPQILPKLQYSIRPGEINTLAGAIPTINEKITDKKIGLEE